MHRHRTAPLVPPALRIAFAGAALLVAAAACSEPQTAEPPPADVVEACNQYTLLVNKWSTDYGAEIGAVEAAAAAGDDARRETSVAVVRELFVSTANGLRDQAGATSDPELAEAMTEAADGLQVIADDIETYEDVQNAPEMMSSGEFAEGGQRVNTICAG
jgi:hypothetical protein